ncbi:MAG: DNA cytosine methyltransferase [Hyphomicrobiaceae bacterium]
MGNAVEHKLLRLRSASGYRPRVLDLFAGCGGLSLGFQAAGFDIAAAIEIDATASLTHAANFYSDKGHSTVAAHGMPRDITKLEPGRIGAEFGLGDPARAIDLIIGGPPCQAYARIGRAKLRNVAARPDAFRVDPRANLYLRYLHYIGRLKPLAILMENVPDIMNFGGHNVVQEICEALDGLGYDARYSLINSAHFGVPQMRDRVFMVAFRKELAATTFFPVATHRCDLPAGYVGQRRVALKLVDLFNGQAYCDAAGLGHSLLPAVTARQAIGDLPAITSHIEGRQRRGAQRFDQLALYQQARPSNYARGMRNWPGLQSDLGVMDHVMRRLPRDTPIFAAMAPGSEYPAAQRLAVELFEREARRRRTKLGTAAWDELRRSMVPPYDPGKFPNRWWKLEANKPVRTLTAHIGKDTYTHIHYDDAQGRVISVREAARLQSFPDGFRFCGSMNAAYRQIGNAVPPLMAKSLAELILAELRRCSRRRRATSLAIAAE